MKCCAGAFTSRRCQSGIAQRMLDIATDYSLSRKQFGVPIAEHQLDAGVARRL